MSTRLQKYVYDAGEHRRKHCGNGSRAEFERIGSAYVGKCPATLSKEQAEELLRDGIPSETTDEQGNPERIYAYYDGAVYEAVPTRPGVSYHGYPWRGRPGHNRLPRTVERELRNQAKLRGEERQLDRWLHEYSG